MHFNRVTALSFKRSRLFIFERFYYYLCVYCLFVSYLLLSLTASILRFSLQFSGKSIVAIVGHWFVSSIRCIAASVVHLFFCVLLLQRWEKAPTADKQTQCLLQWFAPAIISLKHSNRGNYCRHWAIGRQFAIGQRQGALVSTAASLSMAITFRGALCAQINNEE